jgi:hypothetical protein
MASIEEIKGLLGQVEKALKDKFEENDQRHTSLIQGLQTQFSQHESRFAILEITVQQMVNPSRAPTPPPQTIPVVRQTEVRVKSRGFQLSLEKYDGKPKSDLTTWITQVEEKCALQGISDEDIGRWAKVHLEGNALAFISRLGLSNWEDIKVRLQHQFIPRHNNQLLRAQRLRVRQQGDIQNYVHEFQAILNKIDDDMASGDQLFYFITGLAPDCRRYVELHQPTDLQAALELFLHEFRTRAF